MTRASGWMLGVIVTASALAGASRADVVKGPDGAFEAALPGGWAESQTPEGFALWRPQSPTGQGKRLAVLGADKRDETDSPAEQLQRLVAKA
ncbi:MAG: hypothetical protein NTW86_28355, partial [Candidatus Sumerlaeota bacterium]|nr:hypothetical protein [Candidatus Sumerlaeota bacterium]